MRRVCDEQQHWKELTYLYTQYDEWDNAANTMMAHSPDAWEHVLFKDVSIKVSNVEVGWVFVYFLFEGVCVYVCVSIKVSKVEVVGLVFYVGSYCSGNVCPFKCVKRRGGGQPTLPTALSWFVVCVKIIHAPLFGVASDQ